MNETPKPYGIRIDQSLGQPATLANILVPQPSGNIHDLSVLELVAKPKPDGKWSILYRRIDPALDEKPDRQPGYQFLYTDLSTAQQQQFMAGMARDTIRADLYSDNATTAAGLKAYGFHIGQGPGAPFAVPKYVTSNPVLFPRELSRWADTKKQKGDMYEYVFRDTRPQSFRPRHLDDKVNQWLKNSIPRGRTAIYPTRFIAVQEKGAYDRSGNRFLFSSELKKNLALGKTSQRNLDPIQDFYCVSCIELNASFPICIARQSRTAIDAVRQLEEEFIQNFYDEDQELQRAESQARYYCGDDPLNYRSVNLEIAQYQDYMNFAVN